MDDVDLSRFRALLVDWDGTVVDSQPTNFRALRSSLAAVTDIDLAESWYRARLGTSVADLLAELGAVDAVDAVLAHCQSTLVKQAGSLRVFPVVVALVERAKAAGLHCAVVSGGGGVVVRAGVDATGLGHLFDDVVVREDALRGKPAPDLYVEAARRLGVLPHECLAVEDADEGLAAARAAGMAVVDVRDRVISQW
ncbi:HAD family phosphatase [Yinghuangia sp. ASG 101]|uniref:HAD family hydrolase n=1 Tax=Yinghuangia sp. ASG 101 TaxID=2896848 RepID=UPI001E2EC3F2|nr:HAD family phosphatase [Yinghuangia sp. ASG 101]UGQ10507.1 HAD family phosphatase [Yinghuangia sp. ASG 101]